MAANNFVMGSNATLKINQAAEIKLMKTILNGVKFTDNSKTTNNTRLTNNIKTASLIKRAVPAKMKAAMESKPADASLKDAKPKDAGTEDTESKDKPKAGKKASGDGIKNIVSSTVKYAQMGMAWLIKSNAKMENYRTTLKSVMQDEKKATEMIAWAEKLATKAPFDIPQIMEATTALTRYGLDAQKMLPMIGDMAAASGKDISKAVEAFASARSGDMAGLKEFGITKTMMEEQAKRMNLSITNDKGEIANQEALNAVLSKLMEERFKDGMDMQSKTWNGMLGNVKDFMDKFGSTLGAPIFEELKKHLGNLLNFFERLDDSGVMSQIAGKIQLIIDVVYTVIGKVTNIVITKITAIWGWLQAFYEKNRASLDLIGTAIVSAFMKLWSYAQPVLNWLSYNALPLIMDYLTDWWGTVLNIANAIITNWGWIGPFVYGLAIAFGFFGIAILAVSAYTKAAAIATNAWAKAQAIFNAIMNINPIFRTITLIGLLIGAVILLVKNWDYVKEKMLEIWSVIESGFVSGVNLIIQILNYLIEKINLIPGIKIPKIPEMVVAAKITKDKPLQDTTGFSSGKALNQAIPHLNGIAGSGTNIIPPDHYTPQLQNNESLMRYTENGKYNANPAGNISTGSTNNSSVSIKNLIEKIVIEGNDKDPKEIATAVMDEMYEKLKQAKEISGNGRMEGLLYG